MSILPESIDRYRKFFVFIIKYANSDLVKNSSEFSNEITGASDQEEKAFGDKPQDLVEDLKNMGPVFIKLGQLLSTRPDLLPNEYLEALTSLQDDVEEVPYEEIEQIIEEEIGSRISKAFESFDKGPLANASLGQVHRATLRSGKDVAVKIQRPGIRLRVVKDLEVLQEMTDFATKHVNLVRKYDLSSLVEELRHTILQELDYVREARNLEILGENLKQFKEIIIPQAIKDYSTSRVLTMEYISGKKITSISPLAKVENDFSPLVEQLVHA
ncbi:MAG: AarF/ABC1/UbiB kinase family protein, partial [Candidatus Omnitrophica bacterium]|nr:AarF/ABC1/UbiB kinase family protein [Candidatus Omnitrophota bacterium]